MTTRTVMPVPTRRTPKPLTILFAALLLAAAPPTGARLAHAGAVALEGGGGGAVTAEPSLRTPADPARISRAVTHTFRAARPFSASTVTPTDSFLVDSHGFEDLAGTCLPGGWSGEDLTGKVFAHVSGRFTVNDGFLTMGTKALWFGADSTSALGEISHWVRPYGYGKGWSQRLTSPSFPLATNPGAVMRFDASISIRRSVDGALATAFTTNGLVSGRTTNNFVGAEALKSDGTWTFLNSRFSYAGGPPSWAATVPVFDGRWGVAGSLPLQFTLPTGVAVDDSDNVYVADNGNNRVVKYSTNGQWVAAWGTFGGAPGQFNGLYDIAVTHDFKVFVTDQNNSRVEVFDTVGGLLTGFGGPGNGPGQFNTPRGIAVDALDNIYVADTNNNRIEKFDSAGNFLGQWGSFGVGPGLFQHVLGVAVDGAGNVYATDDQNNNVQKFTSSGTFVLAWGSTGPAPGQFGSASGIDVDVNGTIYVADKINNRIQQFRSDGTFLSAWGQPGVSGGEFFQQSQGIAISKRGDVYIADTFNNRIQRFVIGGPIAGDKPVKFEVHLDGDGNQNLGLAEPLRVRIVMQSSSRSSNEDGFIFPSETGVNLVDNVTVQTSGGGDIIAPLDFEDGTTGTWTLSAINGGTAPGVTFPSAIRDYPPPATSVALRHGFDVYDPSCAWTFLSPGDTLANGTFARLTSPWIALVPGDTAYAILGTDRFDILEQARFAEVYARAKRAGDARPFEYHASSFILFGGIGSESNVPLDHGTFYEFPANFPGTGPLQPLRADSIQIVIDILDQSERLLGVLPQQRPTSHLPIIDDMELVQLGVDQDFDGVADAFDACPTVCAAGQDANGDGCVDPTATLHHVESWAGGSPIHYRIWSPSGGPLADPSAFSVAELAAVRAGFATWLAVDGATVPLIEDATTTQMNASALDGINLVTRNDPEVQFPPGVLAITPTTSFTRRTNVGDRIVLPDQIVDSDMMINPNAPWTTTGEAGKYDLQSVVTHEAGHLLGLTHTGVLDATMFFVIQPGQDARTLTDDDRSAIAAAYPSASLATGYATIAGTITRGQTGLPLPGALVEAVHLNGVGAPDDTTASDYSAEDGSYALRRLPAGNYSVRVTPLDGNVGGFPLTPEYISSRLADIAQTTFIPEWWSVPETDRDDPNLRGQIPVVAGQTVTGINVITTVDTIPPMVASVLPANNASNIGVDAPVLVNFSEPVTPASLQSAFRVRKNGNPPSITGTGQLLRGTNFVFTPTLALEFGSSYEIDLTPALQDLNGLALADTFRAVFATQPQPPVSITDIQPRSAPVGGVITITGAGFGDASNTFVAFTFCGACPVSLIPGSRVTPTSLVVRVPVGAITGIVDVTVQGHGTSNDFAFTVLPPEPQAAPIPSGTPVGVGFSPTDAAVSPNGLTAFAAGDGGIASIDVGASARPVTPILSGTFRGTALTPDGSRLVTCRPNLGQVLVIGASPGLNLGQILATITVGGAPGGAAISPNGRRAYVSDQVQGVVHELDIDPASVGANTMRRDLQVPGASLSGGAAVSLDGATLYLSSVNLGLLSVDLTQNTGAFTVLQSDPVVGGVAITPDGGEVLAPGGIASSSVDFVTIPGAGSIVPGSVFLGGSPRGIAMNPAGQSAFIVDSQTNQLRVMNVSPGSGTYHVAVSAVGTGHSPVAVAVSALSTLIGVANYADGTLSFYTTSSANTSAQAVVPDAAMPDGQVAVITHDDLFNVGTGIDLGGTTFTAQYASGNGVGFRVPASPAEQRGTTTTLIGPGGGERSLALPLAIVDPITSFAPHDASFAMVPNPAPISPTETLALNALRVSPDGRLLAIARTRNASAYQTQVQLWWATGNGLSHAFGANLAGTTGLYGSILGMEFAGDGKSVWAIDETHSIFLFDSDPGSATFGQSLGGPPAPSIDPLSSVFAADPLARYMLLGGNVGLTVFSLAGVMQFSFTSAAPVLAMAETPDGHYVVVGSAGGAKIYDGGTILYSSAPLTTTTAHGGVNFTKVAISTNGRRAMGLTNTNQVAVWNLDDAAGAIGQELFFGSVAGLPATISQLLPASDGAGILAGCTGCNTLVRVNIGVTPPTATPATLATNTESLARSSDGRRLYVGQWTADINAATVQLYSQSEATQLAIVSGQGQSGLGGATLPVPIRVRFTDATGKPQEGVAARFKFALPAGSGALDGDWIVDEVQITDVNGEAQVQWSLPATLGPHTLVVTGLGLVGPSVMFTATTVTNDADIIPTVVQFGPTDGQSGFSPSTAVFASFNQKMNTATLPNFMHLTAGGTQNVAGKFSFQDDGRMAIFQPTANLPFGATCTLLVDAGATDTDGQTMAQSLHSTFTIEAPPSLALSSIDPPSASSGATVVLSGQGFSISPATNVVTFNGVLAPVRQASLTSLTTLVPINTSTGPVVVNVGANASSPLQFTVLTPGTGPGTVVGDVPTGTGVSKIAFTPDGTRAYVTNPEKNSVTVLDVVHASVITSVTVGLKPVGIAILPDGSRAYVANSGGNTVSVIATKPGQPEYNTVVKTIPVGAGPVDVVTSGVGPKVFVANSGSGSVSIIDANQGNASFDQVVTTVNTGSGSGAIVVSPDGGRIYVGTAAGVVEVDLGSLVVTTVNTGAGCGSIAISPDGTIVLALLVNGTLVVIDAIPGSPNFNKVVATVNTGGGSGSIAISPDGGLAYLTNADGNILLVFQIVYGNTQASTSFVPGAAVTLRLVATIPVGLTPGDVAVNPNGNGTALVPNAGSGTVTIIGLPTAAPVVMGFTFDPGSLNLKSLGKWVKGTLTPPAPNLATDIVVASIRLNGALAIDPSGGVTVNGGSHPSIDVNFLRSAVQLLLPQGDNVPVTVTGTVGTQLFSGTDYIKVKTGQVTSPHAAEVVTSGHAYAVQWIPASGVQWVALLHSLNHGATWSLDATQLPNNGQTSWTTPDVVQDSARIAVVQVETSTPGDTLVTGVLGVSDYFRLATPTDVEPLPARLEFLRIVPSPSHGSARMHYGLPRAARVDLAVFDVQGRRLRTLADGSQPAGWHDVTWDGTAESGDHVGSGLYFVRLRIEGATLHQRVVWIR